MLKDYLDIIISALLGGLCLFLSKEQLAKIFHKTGLSSSTLKLIRIGGIAMLLKIIVDIVQIIVF